MADWRPDASPGVLLWRASNLWQRQLRAALRQNGLTQAQCLVVVSLKLLQDDNRTAAQQELAAFCGLDVAAVSTVLTQLLDLGLVMRRRGADARVRYAQLTPSGAEIATAIAQVADKTDSEVFASLGDNAPMFRAALQMLLGMRPRMGSR